MICPYKNNKQTLHVFEAKILQFLKKYLTLGGNLIYCLSIFFVVVVVPCISDTFVTFAGNYFHLVKVFLRWTFYSCSMLWLPLEYLKKSIMVARKNTAIWLYLILMKSKLMFFYIKGIKGAPKLHFKHYSLRSLFYSMQVYVSLHFTSILSEN